MGNGMDWIVLSFVDWAGRRNRTHHLAEHLEKRGRVLWVDPPRSLLVHGSLRLKSRSVSDRCTVVELPGALPGRNLAAVSRLCGRFWARRLRRVLETWRDPAVPAAVLVETPAMWDAAELLGADLVVYDAHDDWRLMPGNRAALIESVEARAARAADLVISASDALDARFRALGASPVPVPNACEPGDWEAVDALAPAAEILEAPRPRLLFFGGVDDCFDAGLIRAAAAELPGASWLIVGQVSDPEALKHLRAVPGCRLLGERPYGELPALVAGCDCLILPFRITERSSARDCLKLYEYLATGRPAVSTELPRAREFAGLLELAPKEAGGGGFARACRRALETDSPELRARRRAAAQEHSWARRAAALEAAVAKRLAEVRK
jgi:glycosyltransferase involved in cell wall biosynthesis